MGVQEERKSVRNEDDFKKATSSGNDNVPIELIFNSLGIPINLQDLYRGCPAFLVAGGPSFQHLNHEKLRLPGCLTMAINNAAKSVRPDLWVCVDDPSHFLRSIWLDPKITKFSPISHARRPIFDSDSWKFLDIAAGDCPNALFFKRNDRFHHETYLHEETVNWGNHRRHGGGRSVMLAALRILYYLGVRQVYLLGVDFKMDAGNTYHFSQARHRASIDCNRKTYELLKERFQLLHPLFREAGFEVFNCNPDSELKVFPHLPFDEAVARCRERMPEDTADERSDGLYDRKKTGRSKPPAVQQRQPSPTPLLQTPKVVTAVNGTSQKTPPQCSRGVVIGSDESSEWLLPWWFENYSKHNDVPVTFVDFGMSERARNWCLARGQTIPLPRRYPKLPRGWFYKPAMFLLCHTDKILSIDLDCEIRGSLDPVFDLITDHPVAAKDPIVFREYRKLFRKDFFFNTGVVGALKDHPLILKWGRLTLERHHEFRGDQELFNYALYQHPKAEIVELPRKFNQLRVNGETPEAVIMHWTGDAGKHHIKKQMRELNIEPLPQEF